MQTLTLTGTTSFKLVDENYVSYYDVGRTSASLITPSPGKATLKIYTHGNNLICAMSDYIGGAGYGNLILGESSAVNAHALWTSAVAAASVLSSGGSGGTTTDPNTAEIKLNTATTVTSLSTRASEATLLTRLKPSDTLTGVTLVGTVSTIANALPVGSNLIGKVGIDQATGQNKISLGADLLNVISQSNSANVETTVNITATDVVVANASRRYIEIQNLDTTNPIYIRFGGIASISSSARIAPGGWYYSAPNAVSTAKISIIGVVAGQKISYLELN